MISKGRLEEVLPARPFELGQHLRDDDQRLHAGIGAGQPLEHQEQGLFISAGPQLRNGVVVAPFENINLYRPTRAVRGIQPSPNDGAPAVIQDML